MGYALIWSEGLAVALLSLALATAWAARGGRVRVLWVALVALVFFGPAVVAVVATFTAHSRFGALVQTTWFGYSLTWLAAFALASVFLLRRGLRRPEAGLSRPAAAWPRGTVWLGFGVAVLAFGFTFWNMDLAVRADLAIARQEAGAVLLNLTPPAVAESENAARVYAEATKKFGEPIKDPWKDAAHRGIDVPEAVDWKGAYVVELVKRHEDALALLRKAAAMPRCKFGVQYSLPDAILDPKGPGLPGAGITLLAVDARVKAAEGNLARAFEDVSAILGMVRHLSAEVPLAAGREAVAWRTLEDVLRLAPAGKEPLPPLAVPELPSLVRKVREEQALLGMLMPAAASQPTVILEAVRKDGGALSALAVEALVVPARVFLIPDDVAAMRKLFEGYYKSPRSLQDETPRDWEELRKSVESDPTSIYGAIYIKPKHQVLLAEGARLAALRQTGRTGLAAAAYHRKHGKYPERLEQLVPEFLPAMPVDPRDGQPLLLKRTAEGIVVYAPQDSAVVESGKLKETEGRRPPPIFRLYRSTPREMP